MTLTHSIHHNQNHHAPFPPAPQHDTRQCHAAAVIENSANISTMGAAKTPALYSIRSPSQSMTIRRRTSPPLWRSLELDRSGPPLPERNTSTGILVGRPLSGMAGQKHKQLLIFCVSYRIVTGSAIVTGLVVYFISPFSSSKSGQAAGLHQMGTYHTFIRTS